MCGSARPTFLLYACRSQSPASVWLQGSRKDSPSPTPQSRLRPHAVNKQSPGQSNSALWQRSPSATPAQPAGEESEACLATSVSVRSGPHNPKKPDNLLPPLFSFETNSKAEAFKHHGDSSHTSEASLMVSSLREQRVRYTGRFSI